MFLQQDKSSDGTQRAAPKAGGFARPVDVERAFNSLTGDGDKDRWKENGQMLKKHFINYYRCPEDGEEWADVWSCCCNDRCPKCGIKDIEPYKSEEIVHANPKKT